MKNKKGFTLLELLAVIVILAIIALIAVPIVLNIIDKANKSAFKDTAYGVISAAELYFAEQQLNVNGMQEDATFTFPDGYAGLELKGEAPKKGIVKVTKEGKIGIAIENGRYCVTKSLDDTDVTLQEGTDNCVIPVKITNLTLSQTSVSVEAGTTATVTATFEPSTATNTALAWTTSNASVATVTNGIITGVASGSATITATTTDGSNISKSVTVTVPLQLTELSEVATTSSELGVDRLAPCVTIGTCEVGTTLAIKVNDSDVEKFYVVSDVNDEITLISASNLYSYEYDAAWNTYSATGVSDGPLTALKTLGDLTNTWTNLAEMEISTFDLDDGTILPLGNNRKFTLRARLPKLSEAKLYPDNSYAYWTSTATKDLTTVYTGLYPNQPLSNDENYYSCVLGVCAYRPIIMLSGKNRDKEAERPTVMTSTNNCIKKGNKCSSADILSDTGIEVQVQVNASQSYDFYVLSDTETTVTLIMEDYLSTAIAWYSNQIVYSNSGGPKTLIEKIVTETSGWNYLPMKRYNNGIIQQVMRARLITYDEVTAIKNANGGKLPAYMAGKYWTSTEYPDSDAAYDTTGSAVTITQYYGMGLRIIIELAK